MKFLYQARNKKGEIQSGTIEASSKEAASQLLSQYGFFVTVLEETKNRPLYAKRIEFFDRVSMKEIVMFSRQLAIMFKARVSLVEALQTLAEQMKKQAFREKILEISEEVEAGTMLSKALSAYPKLFSSFYVNMVKSGEASGKLSDVLSYLAEHMEREYHLISRVRGAMIYPAFVMVVMAGVIFLMMTFVMPNLVKVLEDTGQELPLPTKIIIVTAKFMSGGGWAVVLGVVALAIVGVTRYAKSREGRKTLSKVFVRMPLVGEFLKMVYLSRFAENISTLIAGGLPIGQGLEITADIIGNDVYRDIVLKARDEVRKGSTISSVLSRYTAEFPPVFTQMVLVGEKSGSLDTTLTSVVGFYQQEVDRAIDTFLSILEPIMIVVLGFVVAGIMASVLLPLYQSLSS